MGIHFLRGNGQTPRGHALFFARSTKDSQVIYSTYCLIPPIPMSLAKYFPPIFAAQIPLDIEELQGAVRISGMPIPPMLEEGMSLEQLEELAERRDDDLCDLGTISSEEIERMQAASANCQEYAQLYASYIAQTHPIQKKTTHEPLKVDEADTEDILLETMPERQKFAELGKLIGTARYALDGHDAKLLQDTKRRMEQIIRRLPEKYRGTELVAAATGNKPNSGRLAELYLSRAYKLVDEEYADIPEIDRAIQELRTKE